MIKTLLLVGIGGAMGSVVRYLTHWLTSKYFQSSFPLSTFLVNILGSLLIGLFIGYLGKYFPENHPLKFLLIVGFCGGFTTFSTFSNDGLSLLRGEFYGTFITYTLLSIAIGLTAVVAGGYLGKQL